MKIMYTEDQNFSNHLEKILKRGGSSFSCDIEEAVRTILDDVKEKGDQAVIRYSERFDGWKVSPPLLKVRDEERKDAFQFLNDEDIEVLKLAADRIEKFHARQV